MTGDASDEQQGRFAAVDVVTFEDLPARIVIRRGFKLAHGDAVVHYDHLVRVKVRIGGEDILTHARGYGDHAVGMLVGVFLSPRAQIVAAAQLFTFPWTERFKRVRGDDQWGVMQHFGKIAGKTCIPCMRMDDVGINVVGDLQIDTKRLQRTVRILKLLRHVVADDRERPFRVGSGNRGNVGGRARPVECADRHIDTFRQHLGKLFGMHPRAAIHLGRVFTR